MTYQEIMENFGCSRATAFRILKSGKKYNPNCHKEKILTNDTFDVNDIKGLAITTANLGLYLISDPAVTIDDIIQELLIAGWKVSGKSTDKNFLITVFKRKINDIKKKRYI